MTDTLTAGAADLADTLRRLPDTLGQQLRRQGAALAEPIAARARFCSDVVKIWRALRDSNPRHST